jgi:hypothetical protein
MNTMKQIWCSHPSCEERWILIRPAMWEVSKRWLERQDVVISARDLSSQWEGKATVKWQREVMSLCLPPVLLIFYDVCFCKLRDLSTRKCPHSEWSQPLPSVTKGNVHSVERNKY